MERTISQLQGSEYILLCQSFKEWLELLGYSVHSIPSLFYHVRDFLLYQERHQKISLEQLTAIDATRFINELQTLSGVRTKKSYSNGHINKYIQALHLFSQYIRDTGKSDIGFIIERKAAGRAKSPAGSRNPKYNAYMKSQVTVF